MATDEENQPGRAMVTGKRWANEDGLAYGYVMLMACMFMFALVWLALSSAINEMVVWVIQPFCDAGIFSMQTRNGLAWAIEFFGWLPVVAIIGGLLFATNRGIVIHG